MRRELEQGTRITATCNRHNQTLVGIPVLEDAQGRALVDLSNMECPGETDEATLAQAGGHTPDDLDCSKDWRCWVDG